MTCGYVLKIVGIIYTLGCVVGWIVIYTDNKYRWSDGEGWEPDITVGDSISQSLLSWLILLVTMVAVAEYQWKYGLLRRIKEFFDKPLTPKKGDDQ